MIFQVHPEERALVWDQPYSGLIPDSFPLGPHKTGMAHTLDNCIRLTAAGFNPPSPIEHYYRWPRERKFVPEPFVHQKATAAFAVSNPHGFVLNDIGTGKSLSAAWAADYLLEVGAAKRVLIISPLSTLERVWGDTLFIHFPHRTFSVLHGTAERRRKLLADPRDCYIINHDGVGVIQKELEARTDINVVIIDEIATLRNRQTARWKAVNAVIYPPGHPPRPWVWGMTGAPIPNSPEDAYGQCKLVTPTSVPKYFTQWKHMVMEHQSPFVWTPRKEAIDIVYKAMRPAVRFKRDECLDLPPILYQTRDVELSTEQTKHYKEIMRELYTEVKGGRVTAVNEGVKLSKLLQIACGVVYDSTGAPREIDAGNRLETLMELIEQVNERVIVFVPFTAVTGMLARELRKHWNFAVITGDTPVKERNQVFSDFQNPANDLDIIAHPGCMSHGLTLTEASTILWYAPIDSNDTYQQANGRITRAGQKHTANIVNLAGSAVERRIYKRLQDRQKVQGALLEMVERGEQ
ncbi:MAG: ATP-dependent RNA helicase RhlB [Firmicutes bacterium]|nr:ATP-dependent RNA helicase RhlB [Bacillota bacterium]